MTERIAALPLEGLGVGGAILIGDTERGTQTRRDLWLTFTVEGIRVQAPDGAGFSLLAWSGLDAARCAEQVLLPDGRESTVLELTSEGQSLRFLLPHDQLTPRQRDYLEDAVPIWLAAYGSGTVPTSLVPPEAGGAVDQTRTPTATEAAGIAMPMVGEGLPAGTPPPPPPPPGVRPPPAPGASPSPTAGTGQPAPIGSPQTTTTDQSWVPTEQRSRPFVPPPPPPGPEPAPAVDPTTGNGYAGALVPEPPTYPSHPPMRTVPLETGFAPADRSTPFQATGGDLTVGSELDQSEPVVRRRPDNFGRRATDRPPNEDAALPDEEESGDPEDEDEARAHHRWKVFTVVVVLIAAGVGGYFFYRKVLHADAVPAATPADVARAASINLRLSDLPAGFSANAPVPLGPPAATAARRVTALDTLAGCLDQPRSSVRGWFGIGSFPGQITTVRSSTFANPTVPTVEMFSTTALVVASGATSSSLEAALGSPKFPACFGQFQVAALAVPATGQVQAVPLTPPEGVKAYGYETMFTLASGETEIVGDAFVVGAGVVTMLQATTQGPSIPTEYFDPAFQAVARRVARASG